jgi:hypothetical protein
VSDTAVILLVTFGVLLLMLVFAGFMISNQRKDARNSRAARAFHLAATTITRLEGELKTQIDAGYVDPQPLTDILSEYRNQTDKELR